MPFPLALQLYSVREDLAKDYVSVLRQIAGYGYAGVELAGFAYADPAAIAGLLRELDLKVCAAHMPLSPNDEQKVIDALGIVNTQRWVCAFLPPENFASVEAIKKVCEQLNTANAVARANGLTFGYHNHWWECQTVEGRPAYQHMLDYLDPSVFLEVDVYWAKTAGLDPVVMVRELAARAALLHIKDGPAQQGVPMTAAGEGVMDFSALATVSTAEWWIVELDQCATDMLEAVQKSYTYLTQKGLAHGKH